MAELNLRSFQGTDSPILSNKAVQKEYDTPDDVSEEFDAKNELFNATGKLIGTAAKIAGHIEKDRQNSVVEYIKEQTIKFIQKVKHNRICRMVFRRCTDP